MVLFLYENLTYKRGVVNKNNHKNSLRTLIHLHIEVGFYNA